MTQQLEEVRAITWQGQTSFPMVGVYIVDNHGRAVVGLDRRWQIPNDVIIERRPHVTQPPMAAPEPSAAPPIPVEAALLESTPMPASTKRPNGKPSGSKR
jgi:hypothetical protein